MLAVSTVLAGSLIVIGDRGDVRRDAKLYRAVAARATSPIATLAMPRSAEAVAACLDDDPTGRLPLEALSRAVDDRTVGVRYDRVLLNRPVALLIGVVEAGPGRSRLMVRGRPGRRLHDREVAAIIACR